MIYDKGRKTILEKRYLCICAFGIQNESYSVDFLNKAISFIFHLHFLPSLWDRKFLDYANIIFIILLSTFLSATLYQ